MTTSATIASKDFSSKTINALAKKGVEIVRTKAVPAFEGDQYFSGVAYMLSFNGSGFLRTHSQVLVMANSSWNPQDDQI
jgi:hypothetical protein